MTTSQHCADHFRAPADAASTVRDDGGSAIPIRHVIHFWCWSAFALALGVSTLVMMVLGGRHAHETVFPIVVACALPATVGMAFWSASVALNSTTSRGERS